MAETSAAQAEDAVPQANDAPAEAPKPKKKKVGISDRTSRAVQTPMALTRL